MIAGLVFFSAAVGMVAMIAAFALSFPAWVALASYPVICGLTLLFTAAILGMRGTEPAQDTPLLRPQA